MYKRQVLGTIFAGAVHDYLSGMLSIRHEGESLPEIIGRYLGLPTKQLMRGFTVVLMILVGAVFVAGPAGLLSLIHIYRLRRQTERYIHPSPTSQWGQRMPADLYRSF